MTFTADDMDELASVVAEAWSTGRDRDWSAPAGTLTWSCTDTAVHAVDTVLAPALFLASRKEDGYVAIDPITLGPAPTVDDLVEGLATGTRTLTAVVAAAPPEARAAIWLRPTVEVRGPADFLPRGALELILHAHDVCSGLGVPFAPPAGLCDRLRRHTRDWPMWDGGPGWHRPSTEGDSWADLLACSGRH